MPEINERGDSQSAGGIVGAMLVGGTCNNANEELGCCAVGHDAVQRKPTLPELCPYL